VGPARAWAACAGAGFAPGCTDTPGASRDDQVTPAAAPWSEQPGSGQGGCAAHGPAGRIRAARRHARAYATGRART